MAPIFFQSLAKITFFQSLFVFLVLFRNRGGGFNFFFGKSAFFLL
jgi:hypothetical protein